MMKKMLLPTIFFALSVLQGTAVDIGNRRELLIDDFLIESIDGASFRMHHPEAREVSLVTDQLWEGNICCYFTLLQDEKGYKLYYRGGQYNPPGSSGPVRPVHREYVCYAESADGIHWSKPSLRQVEFNGSKENNILAIDTQYSHCFTPFLDVNPAVSPDARYKAVSGHAKSLYALKSPDGIHWKLLQNEPILDVDQFRHKSYAFDSQNLAFFDSEKGKYVIYFRQWFEVRAIMRTESDDFIHWSEPERIKLLSGTEREFYTNVIMRYPRAPELFLGLPNRFNPSRKLPANTMRGLSDTMLMSSRDGIGFSINDEAFIRPGRNPRAWFNRNNMVSWGMAETPAPLDPDGTELSLYLTENYYEGNEVHLRRYAIRPDGFRSMHAGETEGRFTTKPLRFTAIKEEEGKRIQRRNCPLTVDASRGILKLDRPTILEIPDSADLGKQVTLAVRLGRLPELEQRIFSAYNGIGEGPVEQRVMTLTLTKSNLESSFCFAYSSLQKVEFSGKELTELLAKPESHHFAVTWNDGLVELLIDGKKVAKGGQENFGALKFDLGNLRFGNDYPPNTVVHVPLLGEASDILVLKRKLSDDELTALAQVGAEKTLNLDREKGMLYTMANDCDGDQLHDALTSDKAQNAFVPPDEPWGRTMLLLNAATSVLGTIRVEIQDENGVPIPGYTAAECDELYGDGLDLPVSWRKGDADLTALAEKNIKLKFVLEDADVFAFRFGTIEKKGKE